MNNNFSFDFLSLPVVKRIIIWKGFPVVFQLVNMVILIGLPFFGFGIGLTETTQELLLLRKTNLTTLVVWGLWWPSMVIVAIVLGRLWCTLCPVELANRISDAVARRVGYPRAKISLWLKHGWAIVLLYLLLQFLVAVYFVHRVPHYAALMPLTLLGLAIITGLIFKESRSFCKILCPAGALLSVYSRFTPVQLDVRDSEVCKQCTSHDCVAQKNRYKLDARSCPTLIQPFQRRQSDGCINCFQCAKVCPHDNVGFGFARREAPSRVVQRLKPFESLFIMMVAGFVTYEIAAEVPWVEKVFLAVPRYVVGLLPTLNSNVIGAVWMLLVFPGILWGLAGLVARGLGYAGNIRDLLIAMATGAAPAVAVMHFAKALAKLSSWGPYLPLSLSDPYGIATLQAIINRTMAEPGSFVSIHSLGTVLIVALLLMAWHHWNRIRHAFVADLKYVGLGALVTVALYESIMVAWMKMS